jgi:hypothetical protein
MPTTHLFTLPLLGEPHSDFLHTLCSDQVSNVHVCLLRSCWDHLEINVENRVVLIRWWGKEFACSKVFCNLELRRNSYFKWKSSNFCWSFIYTNKATSTPKIMIVSLEICRFSWIICRLDSRPLMWSSGCSSFPLGTAFVKCQLRVNCCKSTPMRGSKSHSQPVKI